MMGAQDAHRGAQKTACCMCFDISDALSQERKRHVEPYCDRRLINNSYSHLQSSEQKCKIKVLFCEQCNLVNAYLKLLEENLSPP